MARKVKRISHITVGDFYSKYKDELKLELVGQECGFERQITEPATNRPGLAFAGFLEYFAHERVQVLGNSEISYLNQLDKETLIDRVAALCLLNFPCLVISRGAEISEEFVEVVQHHSIPVFKTPLLTFRFINSATLRLETEFAETTTAHGCMLNYRGVGILIKGKSGSGKSETATGLVERGGSLVADDHVKIRNVNGELTAYTEGFSRGFIEMRGIGIINVANIYGLGSIQPDSKLDLIVNLRPYSDLNEVDRVGVTRETEEVLGVEVPFVDIPVAPGRDTARLVAVTALELQLRRLGYDMAGEFNHRLNEKLARQAHSTNSPSDS